MSPAPARSQASGPYRSGPFRATTRMPRRRHPLAATAPGRRRSNLQAREMQAAGDRRAEAGPERVLERDLRPMMVRGSVGPAPATPTFVAATGTGRRWPLPCQSPAGAVASIGNRARPPSASRTTAVTTTPRKSFGTSIVTDWPSPFVKVGPSSWRLTSRSTRIQRASRGSGTPATTDRPAVSASMAGARSSASGPGGRAAIRGAADAS